MAATFLSGLLLGGGAAGAGRPAGKPAYLWLWYADGGPSPQDGPKCSGLRPPAFTAPVGTTLEDWQRQVQAYLDLWYADFNLVFTLTRPPTGDYYIVIITSDGAWCHPRLGDAGLTEAGLAYFNCFDNQGQMATAYAFECGSSAHGCAAIIAHEHGHMVGLLHTTSSTDIMNETIRATAAGFENGSSPVDLNNPSGDITTPDCNRKDQNSYQMMVAALGPWPAGTTKPALFPGSPDAGADAADAGPAVGIDASHIGTPIYNLPPLVVSDGGSTVLPGFDALIRPPLPVVDAAARPPSGKSGGCNLGHTGSALSPAVWVALLTFAAARRSRRSATCARDRPARRS